MGTGNVMAAAWLAVAIIGQALALARGLVTKQVDRLLGNNGIDLRDEFTRGVPHRSGAVRTAWWPGTGQILIMTANRCWC